MKKTGSAWYHIAAIIIVGIWGMTFISSKVLLLAGLQPAEIFVLRFIIAYIGIWLITPHRKLFCNSLKDEFRMLVVGITGGSLYFWTENTAIVYSQACNVSFIVCTTPLVTGLLACALRRTRMSRNLAIGTAVAIIGMAMVIFNGQHNLKLSPKGDFLALMASFCWAVYSIIIVDLTKKYDTRFATRKVFFYGLITAIPLFVFEPWHVGMPTLMEPKIILNILFLGIIASLGCYALWNPVMKRLGVVAASNYIYLNPVFTLLGSIVILHERFTLLAALGSAVILLGVILAGREEA